MARSPIPIIVFGPNGAPLSGATVKIQKRGTTTNSIVYANDLNSATSANPITSDAYGRVAGWLERGSYQAIITASGMSQRTEYFDSITAEMPISAIEQQEGVDVEVATGLTGNPVTVAMKSKLVAPKIAAICGTITINNASVSSMQLHVPTAHIPAAHFMIPVVLQKASNQFAVSNPFSIIARQGSGYWDVSGITGLAIGDKFHINMTYQVI